MHTNQKKSDEIPTYWQVSYKYLRKSNQTKLITIFIAMKKSKW